MALFNRKRAPDAPVVEAPKPPPPITIGTPGRCPVCDGFGFIDVIDVVHNFQEQHCKECNHVWEYHFDAEGHVIDLTEHADAPDPLAGIETDA